MLLGRDMSLPWLIAPNLLTEVKGADLVIRGNVVLNTLSARSTSTLPRDQICIDTPSSRHVPRPSRTVLRDRLRFSLYAMERYVYCSCSFVVHGLGIMVDDMPSPSWCCVVRQQSCPKSASHFHRWMWRTRATLHLRSCHSTHAGTMQRASSSVCAYAGVASLGEGKPAHTTTSAQAGAGARRTRASPRLCPR
jgi:hypothetical protein